MRIAVYPGSFDPLHIGHLAVMEYLSRHPDFDWVYLVISPQNPFKDPSKALSARRRYLAAQRAVARHPELRVWVDDIELHMDPPNYTIRTLDALKEREPGNEFTLVVGADNLAEIEKWREAPRLLSEYGLAVYPRRGFDIPSLAGALDKGARVQVVDAPMVDISSTEIREALANGKDMSAYMM